MRTVGIIANPASGKDIRRLVAYGSVFDNYEKVNIVRRVLRALDALSVQDVVFMPDYYGIGLRAMEDLSVSMNISFIEMGMKGTHEDSTKAAAIMAEMDIALIITLGGDGTNRAIAKSCDNVPLLPISTGTNNVFPFMVEGTLAGIAAGLAAAEKLPREVLCKRTLRLEIFNGNELKDIALVDAVVSKSDFIGTKAIWDTKTLKEIFLTRSQPSNIGFSSVGGSVCPLGLGSGQGLHLVMGPGGKTVIAAVAPGIVSQLPIQAHRIVNPGENIPLSSGPGVLALDGEREIILGENDEWSISLSERGPFLIDVENVLLKAAEDALFVVQ